MAHGLFVAVLGLFSSCGMRALEPMGLVTPGMWDLSSPTRDRTRVPCIGRWILNHCTTREVSWGIVLKDITSEWLIKDIL